jgi:hypothetical protein
MLILTAEAVKDKELRAHDIGVPEREVEQMFRSKPEG